MTMDSSNLNRELTGVLFPGIVKNDEKAIACLGGIRNISQVFLTFLIILPLHLLYGKVRKIYIWYGNEVLEVLAVNTCGFTN